MATDNIIPMRAKSDALIIAERMIAESMARDSERSEKLLREMRRLLGFARDIFPVDVETADAFAARAANKLALAICTR